MKQFIIGLIVGASLSTGAFAANPIANLPVQEQLDRIISAVDKQFDTVGQQFAMAQMFFTDIDGRLNVIEKKLRIKRDE